MGTGYRNPRTGGACDQNLETHVVDIREDAELTFAAFKLSSGTI